MFTQFKNSFSAPALRANLQEYFFLTLGALILAISYDLFSVPAQMAPGGVGGLSLIINSFTGWPRGLIMNGLAIPVLVLGFFNLGRYRFLSRTVYVTLVSNTAVDILAQYIPPHGLTQDLLLSALFGGIIGGIGTGLTFWGQGTFAGTGIISRVLQLKTGIPLSQFYIMIDGVIILALGFTFGWDRALYALIMLFVWGLAADYVLEGPSVVRTAFIVTDSPQQVSEALLTQMRVGVTAWQGQGMYTGTHRTVLFCTISRPDVGRLKSVVSEVAPGSFIVIGQGHQASGGVLK